jgi:hypothetical protein
MRGIEMKKTEKLKGKERVAAKKKQTTMIAVAAGVIIIVALASWFFSLTPPLPDPEIRSQYITPGLWMMGRSLIRM